MGGDLDGICSLPSAEIVPRTVLLVGRTGNGKSSTGNSIIGKSVFKSDMSFSGVTTTLDCQTAIFPDGRALNVIDTPGLFDFHVGSEFIKKEIMKCIELAKDGIHAIILVLSLRTRFSEDEAAAVQSLSTFFGPTITDYMIVLFTNDDCLKRMSREDYLRNKTPHELQELLRMCKNRTVFFDNETDDEEKKELQLTKLLSLVDNVVEDNCGQPYTDSLFKEFKEAAMLQQQKEEMNASTEHSKEELIKLTEKIQSSYDEQLKRMTDMVESKLRETNQKLEEQLAHEREARSHAERVAEEAKREADLKMQKLSMELAETFRTTEKNKEDAERIVEEAKREAELKMEKLNRELAESVKTAERTKEHEMNRMREEMENAKRMALEAQNKCAIL